MHIMFMYFQEWSVVLWSSSLNLTVGSVKVQISICGR